MNTETITRSICRNEVRGTLVIKDGKYKYDYPANREIAKKLLRGDSPKIAKKLGYTRVYVKQVLNGTKYNELILIEANLIAELNVKNNWVTL